MVGEHMVMCRCSSKSATDNTDSDVSTWLKYLCVELTLQGECLVLYLTLNVEYLTLTLRTWDFNSYSVLYQQDWTVTAKAADSDNNE